MAEGLGSLFPGWMGAAAVSVTVALSGGGTSSQTASGTAPASATVTVSKNGSAVGTAAANASGAWSYTLTVANGDQVTASVPVTSTAVTAAVTAPLSNVDFSIPANSGLVAAVN